MLVICAGEVDDTEKLHASLNELLSRLGVDLSFSRTSQIEVSANEPSTKETVAVAWVDIRKDEIDLTIGFRRTNEPSLTLAKRSVDRKDGGPLSIEAAAHVLQAALEDALDAEKAAKQEPAPAPTPTPAVAPSEPSVRKGVSLDVGAAFGGRAFGADAPFVFGGGGFAKLAFSRGQWQPALSLSGTLHVPFSAEGSVVQVEVQTLSLRLLPSLTLWEGKSWALEAGAGGGADVFFPSPRSSVVPQSVLRRPHADAAPILSAFVTARLAIAESADVFLTLGADADLGPPRYVTETNNVHSEVFTPARVRPFLLVGFAITTFGPKPYAANGAQPSAPVATRGRP